VLLAMGDGFAHETTSLDKGIFYFKLDYGEPGFEWNLKDDNLDHQSDETKEFLINLLLD